MSNFPILPKGSSWPSIKLQFRHPKTPKSPLPFYYILYIKCSERLRSKFLLPEPSSTIARIAFLQILGILGKLEILDAFFGDPNNKMAPQIQGSSPIFIASICKYFLLKSLTKLPNFVKTFYFSGPQNACLFIQIINNRMPQRAIIY